MFSNHSNQSVLHLGPVKIKNTTLSSTQPNDEPFKIFEIALVLIFLFGLFGNILSILVMRSKRMRNTNASIFIILISILDSLFLFFRNFGMFYKKYQWSQFDTTCLITNSMTVAAQVSPLTAHFF